MSHQGTEDSTLICLPLFLSMCVRVCVCVRLSVSHLHDRGLPGLSGFLLQVPGCRLDVRDDGVRLRLRLLLSGLRRRLPIVITIVIRALISERLMKVLR